MSGNGPVRLSRAEARHLLGAYHFTSRSLTEAVDHLGTLQYDPLRPMGRNPDLVLQARVPGYRENGWERLAYRRRLLFDAWDKQACLIPVETWPYRRVYDRYHRREWGEHVLDVYPDVVRDTVRTILCRGPMSSLDFGEDPRPDRLKGSWYGNKLIKHVLRGLWMSGELLTHHRDNGRHVYDLPRRVLPEGLVDATDPGDDASFRFLLKRRVQASGLLRPTAPVGLWSMPLAVPARQALLAELVDAGALLRIEVEGTTYLALPEAMAALDAALPRGMRFLAPLDGLLWDRTALARLYDFEYRWEVYVPEPKRRWGYYVLPVWHGGDLVGRLDGRREDAGKVWKVLRFEWERRPSVARLNALTVAARRFASYLGADSIAVEEGVDARTRAALLSALRT